MKHLLTFLFVFLLTSFSNTFASHIPGGNITYECTGNPNEYIITLELFVTCPLTLGFQHTLIASNDCGLTNPTVTLPQVGSPQEIASICPSILTECNGGSLPGVMIYTYQNTITLPDTCDSWTLAFDLCCRNSPTNLSGGSSNSMYFETVMNSSTAPCDNSPYTTTQPSPFFCAAIPQSYCPGIIDPDGDSLYIQLINPLGGGGTPIAFNPPYTVSAPLQNLILDNSTGCFTFNEPVIGSFVITYLIETFDNSGNMTGSVIYDFQFQMVTCSNTPPTPDPAGIVLTGGTGSLLNPNLIQLCEGETTCFDVIFNDIDAPDTISIDTTLSTLFNQLPGAILSINGTNPLTVNVCWTAPVGIGSSINTILTVNDGACPVMGFSSENINFSIINSTVANSDITICGNQSAQLTANGGSVFTWNSIAGDPINIGVNFSCNPCSNPIATPTVTTTYTVTSNLGGGCTNVDTVTVSIAPDFTLSTYGDSLLCDYYSVPIGFNTSPAGVYSVLWSPAVTLDNPTNLTPIASPTDTTTYYAAATSPLGCTKTDSVLLTVVPPPALVVFPGDTSLCGGSPIQFNVESSCDYTLEMFDSFGDGWNNQSLNIYEDGILIGTYTVTAANNGGNFNTVTFPVINGSSIIITYNTGVFQAESSFNLIDGTGTTQFSVAQGGMAGWIQGDTIFTGTANCGPTLNGYSFLWTPSTGLNDDTIQNPIATPTVTTTYTVTLTSGVCSVDRSQTVTIAPDFTLTTFGDTALCSSASVTIGASMTPPGTYTINWNPGATLNDSTILSPIATPVNTTQYIATVSSGLGCTKSDTVTVSITNLSNIILSPDDTTICEGESLQFGANLPSLIFDDNFNGGYDSTLWSSAQGIVATGCGSNSGDALHFDGAGPREITSIAVNTTSCSFLDFCLIIANDSSAGAPCENADAGEDVVLSYSTTGAGGPWTVIQTFLTSDWDTGGPYANSWECFSIAIPIGAQTNATNFKWEQAAFSGCVGCDNWSLDDVSFPCESNGFDYSWSPGNELSDSNIVNPIAIPSATTNYTFTVIDSLSGCSGSNSQLITVLPSFILQTTPDDSICLGDTVNFITSPSVGSSYTYLWSPGSLLSDSTIFNPVGIFNNTGITLFTVEVTNTAGCSVSDSVLIVVDSCSVGVDEFSERYRINIFPNPTNGTFNITKPEGLNKPIGIKLFNVLGELLIEDRLNQSNNSTIINISERSKGLYLLHLIIDDQTVVKRIIKD